MTHLSEAVERLTASEPKERDFYDEFPTMAADATFENLSAAYPSLPVELVRELLTKPSIMFRGVQHYRSYEDYTEH